MKAFLMYRDRDFDPQQILSWRDKDRRNAGNDLNLQKLLPWNGWALTGDLGLDILCKAMGVEDEFLLEVANVALLSIVTDLETIRYRQQVFADCLKNERIARDIYKIATDAIKAERSKWRWTFTRRPSSILHLSVEVLQVFVGMLKRLRAVADEHTGEFDSEGFSRLFDMLKEELTDEYFAVIKEHLRHLKFRGGVLVSAEPGKGNKGKNYVLRKLPDTRGWIGRLVAGKPKGYTHQINPRDEIGIKTLSRLNDAGMNLVANAAAQSADHILSFFQMLRTELAFYIGCLNLHAKLVELGRPTCAPTPAPAGERKQSFTDLYDARLALSTTQRVVGNDMHVNRKNLFIITGANSGGKSTFLCSVGIAQLMMQAGMFVPARSFYAEVCEGIFTHYKREEDQRMESGKWDEELKRMSEIVDHIKPNSLMLCNESFASTNEREGSEIAKQIIMALLEKQVKVFFVTHLYSLARSKFEQKSDIAMFLRAERRPDGTRPFKLVEGEPLQTSYGEDLYSIIFSDK